jgi:NAD(P)-dependent dehydrogenase (short-subunit alcohol dehydrogenase family)
MADGDMVVTNSGSGIGWFVAGALAVAGAIALFLYADGYFDKDSVELKIELPKVTIEGQ